MALIFLHGLGQGPESWRETAAAMGVQENALCPELSGFLPGEQPDYQGLFAGFSAWCRSLEGPVHLCGLSLGAVLALHYGLEHPEQTASLVLIAPQFSMPKTLLKIQSAIFSRMPQKAFQGTGLGKRKFLSLTASMAELDFSARLSELSCPVLVLCGQKDKVNARAARQLAGALAGGSFQSVPAAGHEVNREQPELLARMLETFYENLGIPACS